MASRGREEKGEPLDVKSHGKQEERREGNEEKCTEKKQKAPQPTKIG